MLRGYSMRLACNATGVCGRTAQKKTPAMVCGGLSRQTSCLSDSRLSRRTNVRNSQHGLDVAALVDARAADNLHGHSYRLMTESACDRYVDFHASTAVSLS